MSVRERLRRLRATFSTVAAASATSIASSLAAAAIASTFAAAAIASTFAAAALAAAALPIVLDRDVHRRLHELSLWRGQWWRTDDRGQPSWLRSQV